jgi:hypothetical protein
MPNRQLAADRSIRHGELPSSNRTHAAKLALDLVPAHNEPLCLEVPSELPDHVLVAGFFIVSGNDPVRIVAEQPLGDPHLSACPQTEIKSPPRHKAFLDGRIYRLWDGMPLMFATFHEFLLSLSYWTLPITAGNSVAKFLCTVATAFSRQQAIWSA